MKENIAFEPEDRFLKVGDCLKVVPVASSTWWEGVREGRYPEPVRIGGNTFWRYSDVMKLIKTGRIAS